MCLKKTQSGKYMLSCMGWPQCTMAVFFPQFVLEMSVDSSVCTTCSPGPVQKVQLKLNRSSIPSYMESQQTVCIGGCDEDMNQVLGISYRAHSRDNTSARSNNSTYRPRGTHNTSSSSSVDMFINKCFKVDGILVTRRYQLGECF